MHAEGPTLVPNALQQLVPDMSYTTCERRLPGSAIPHLRTDAAAYCVATRKEHSLFSVQNLCLSLSEHKRRP